MNENDFLWFYSLSYIWKVSYLFSIFYIHFIKFVLENEFSFENETKILFDYSKGEIIKIWLWVNEMNKVNMKFVNVINVR